MKLEVSIQKLLDRKTTLESSFDAIFELMLEEFEAHEEQFEVYVAFEIEALTDYGIVIIEYVEDAVDDIEDDFCDAAEYEEELKLEFTIEL
jgi:hypothetical protein